MAFAQYAKVRRMIVEIALDPKQTFWIMTHNLLADTAAIEWCKVFGSWDEGTHWTNIIRADRHEAVRSALLQELGMTKAEWEKYHGDILQYRNEIVAHHDVDATVMKYPHYDKALVAANFMFERLRNEADPNFLGGIPLELEGWSDRVVGNMSAIVRKAFDASKTLGPNA